ncbi:FAD-dependent oxidoreductase [Nonomuraea sp. NEAU-A123]|uniref:FAD-dependent oxidoreductase n=1 Tax=Nonomuraea sp. NEAU-A123 TaxID=2839649 RepID=UPI001BE48AA3|nr:FAD-dependent oxidoreductase [Nonomuraea sp. NEAU-A123]MBT2227861.1 aminotransferase class V-fold PLP-dependent enzyme [Nonomuraea sp. NEAU-A123]
MSSIDLAALRANTPGTLHAHHFNAAGAALPSAATLAAVIDHLNLEARVGGYEAAEAARERTERVYDLAAALLGAEPGDIALVESATVAWQRAVSALRLGPGDRILASASSYVSSALHLLELRGSRGVRVEVLPADGSGRVDLDALERALRTPAALVTVAHVPTSSGLVEPVAEVGALAAAAGVPVLLDATQSAGQLPVAVGPPGCDIVVATGRKFLRGPRGTGLLYVSPRMREVMRPSAPDVRGARWVADQSFDLAHDARRYETWEAAHALRLGLGVALAEALELGVDRIQERIGRLADRLRRGLESLPGVRLADPPGAGCGIVTFVREGQEPAQTARELRAARFHLVSVPAAHGQWDLGRRGLPAVVRASAHVYNNEDDVDALLTHLAPAHPRRRTARAGGFAGTGGARADVIVVGAGVHGSSAAWQLARRGAHVIHLDRFPAGHVEGSSHGRTRMIRRAYPSPVWDEFVDRAYDAWADLERDAGRTLVTTVGGLFARPATAPGGLRGPGCQAVDPDRAAGLFPGLALGPEFTAVHDPAAGVIDAAGALRCLAELGRAYGVDQRFGCSAQGWQADGDGVTVETDGGTVRADRLVVCAGPWTAELLPEFAGLLRVVRIVNVHIGASRPELLSPPRLGPFAVDVPDVGLMYGIPAFGGSGVKIGLDHGPADDLGAPRRAVTSDERETLLALARRFLPAADGQVEEEISCRYTMAPGNRFAVGALPGRPQVLVAAACSGHGFKFGPAIGAALADLAMGTERPDLAFLAPAAMGVG